MMFSTSSAHVTGLGEGGGVGDGERDRQDLGEGLRQERLAVPVGPMSRMFDFCSSTSERLRSENSIRL